VEMLEDRIVPFTYIWNGLQSSNFNLAANWTDVANSTHHSVPDVPDTAIIQSSSNDPVMSQNHKLASLQINGGLLTLNANLTDTGTFLQSGGSVNLNSNLLQIGGDVTRTGGTFSTTGTVNLDGTAGQTVMDTSFGRFPGTLLISNNSTAGVTLPGTSNLYTTNVTLNSGSSLTLLQGAAASFLWVSGNFTDNGKIVMSQLTSNGGTSTSLINLGTGTLAVGSTATMVLNVANPVANAVYTFARYGVATGTLAVGGNTTVNGNQPFGASASLGGTSLIVTLTPLGTIDTWLGTADSNFANTANWSTGVVPGANDFVIIKGAPHDPIVSTATTIKSLQVIGGFLTVNATLTDIGDYSQSAGFITIGSAGQLQIQGNVNRTGGQFIGPATSGAVVLSGTNAQSITDTSGHPLGINLTVNSGATVTVQAGSVLNVGSIFTNYGTVNMTMASPSSATPLVIGTNLVEGSGSVFNFNLGNTNAGLAYIFLTFGGTDPGGATFNANAGTVQHNSNNISVAT
jgi:hypothetical protein